MSQESIAIIVTIIGVGLGLWRNATKAHESIGLNINRLEGKIDNLTKDVTRNTTDLAWIK